MLQAFFDESGTHGGAIITAVAGYIADSEQWKNYKKRTSELFVDYNVSLFHAIDIKNGRYDYKGWTVDKKIQFLDEFQHIINEELAFGISACISNADYQYHLNRKWPSKIRRESKYTILFRACMASAIGILQNEYRKYKPTLRTIFERGHKNVGDIERCYRWICDAHPDSKKVLLALSFEDKRNSLELAAADLLAYTVLRLESEMEPIGEARHPLKSVESYSKNIRRIIIDKNVLDDLYEQALKLNLR
jgi:hypothetical protein